MPVVSGFTFFGQWKVFENSNIFALSLLVGSSATLCGAFAALLASPKDAKDEGRISKIAPVVLTLVSGFLVIKVIDPLISNLTKNLDFLNDIHVQANILVAIIAFIGGFLGTYQIRILLSEKEEKNPTESAKTDEKTIVKQILIEITVKDNDSDLKS